MPINSSAARQVKPNHPTGIPERVVEPGAATIKLVVTASNNQEKRFITREMLLLGENISQ